MQIAIILAALGTCAVLAAGKTIAADEATTAKAPVPIVGFQSSHRIPDHLEAVRRQHADEQHFHTAHQIPSPPPPVVVALHPKTTPTSSSAAAASAEKVTEATSTKGHRHRREEPTTSASHTPLRPVADATEEPEHHLSLVFPLPVSAIVKHSDAAPEIHHRGAETAATTEASAKRPLGAVHHSSTTLRTTSTTEAGLE